MKKKLLFIPLHWEHGAQSDLFDELKEFFEVRYLAKQMYSYDSFDYIYFQFGALNRESLENLKSNYGAKVIGWTGDCREELMPNVLEYKGVVDLCLLSSGIAQKEMYEEVMGCPIGYLQHPFFSHQIREPKELVSGSIVFIGNNYDHFPGAIERSEMCKVLSSVYTQFEVVGNGFNLPGYNNQRSCSFEKTSDIYNEAYISISSNIYNDKEGYWSCRTTDIMAAGSCCFTRYVPNLEKYFKDGEHCIFFANNSELIEKINYICAHPEIRNRIAKAGHEEALKNHSCRARVEEIINHIKNNNL
jgi:glycosyltransferase involved in cell wall biosynthesis